MTDLITQADLEYRLGGPVRLVQLADDDGDGTADPAIVSAAIDEASRLAEGILWSGFPNITQIATLVANDSSLRGAISDIGIALLGDRRPEFVNDAGKPRENWRRAQGEKVLRDIARTDRRAAAGEAVAGANTELQSRSSREKPPTTFVFSDTGAQRAAGGRGPGGF